MEVELIVRSYQECYDIYSADVQVTEAQLCADVPEGGKGVCLVKFPLSIFKLIKTIS
jgi:hypothetical protein